MSIDGLAWALVHSVWQGAVIAGVGGASVRALHGAPAQLRYRVLGALLLAQLGGFAATLVWLAGPAAEPTGTAAVPAAAAVGPTWPLWLVVAWGLGVSLLGARLVVGLHTTARWRRRSIPAPPAWLARFERLRRKLGIDRHVDLRLGPDGLGPMAIGMVRPVVLVPACLLVQLPAAQLEAVLLHELAHVRRLDWAVNLAQSVAETVLFHHPATWWLSNRIRHERELCCDALAASAVADPLVYARALTELDALRVLPLSVAANGGNLMDRIRRLVGAPQPPHRNPWVVPAVVIGLMLGGVSVAARGTAVPEHEARSDGDDGSAASDETDEPGTERPLAAEDVGATVLDAIADQLHRGARKLEDNAERRFLRKHPEAAPAPPAPAPLAPAPLASLVPAPPALAPPAPPPPGAECHQIRVDGASVSVCDDGTVRVGTGNRAVGANGAPRGRGGRWAAVAGRDAWDWEAWAEDHARAWEAQAEVWEAQADVWEARAEVWAEKWEAQAEAWEGQADVWAETWEVEASRAAARAERRARIQVPPPGPSRRGPVEVEIEIMPLE